MIFVFFYGDLNYRIDGPSFNDVTELVQTKQYSQLQGYDQLHREKANLRVLNDFYEDSLNFQPTYRLLRYEHDTNKNRIYDPKKNRVPSWCDRILSKRQPGFYIKRTAYEARNLPASSDHMPIFATFELGIRMPPTTLASLSDINDYLVSGSGGIIHIDGFEACFGTITNLPSPYVKFFAPFLMKTKYLRTKTKKKTETPRWGDLSLPLLIYEKEYIQSCYIICVFINDYGISGQSGGTTNSLGQAIIPLSNACGAHPFPFCERIINRGKVWGTTNGTIHVTGLKSMTDDKYLWHKIGPSVEICNNKL